MTDGDPLDITTPAPDAGPTIPPLDAPPVSPNGRATVDPFAKLNGDIGLIYRELGEIHAGVQATRLMLMAAAGVLVLAVVLMARSSHAAG